MRQVWRESACAVGVHVVVDGLLAYMDPLLAEDPAICEGDQSSSMIICSIRHHSSSGLRWLPLRPCFRASDFVWALHHTYSPSELLLRFTSRDTVDGDMSNSEAITALSFKI